MNHQAKAMSTGATQHRSLARGRPTLLAIGIAVVCLLAFAPGAFAAKGVVNFIGSSASGTAEGQFSFAAQGPGGVAVNQAGTDATGGGGASAGDVYVVDRGNNRIQQFDASGNFVRTFGANVGGLGVNVCTVSCTAGSATSEAGGMNRPQGVAVDQATGLVYVTDQLNRRVDIFSAGGVFQGAFGWGALDGSAAFQFCSASCSAPNTTTPNGGEAGKFGETIGFPAVSPSGDVYVADRTNRRIDVFTPTISGGVVTAVDFDEAFGWGVDTGADAFENCTALSTCQQGLSSSSTGGFGQAGPASLAIDSAGNSYVIDTSNSRVEKFDPSNQPLAVFAGSDLSGSPSPVDIAADRSNNHLLVIKPCNSTICPATPSEDRALEFDSGGALLDTHAQNGGINAANAIAVSQGSGNIYLSSATGGYGAFILNTIVPPVATIDPGSGFVHDANSATFTGTINPTGFTTGWHFEYSTDGSNWTRIPASDITLPHTDSVAHAVSQEVSGLIGGTLYHVRLVATKPFGAGTSISQTSFTTDPGLPLISGELASNVTETAATLNGEVNPDNLETTWHFEYTNDADFQANGFDNAVAVPVPDAAIDSGVTPVPVQRQIAGLEPGTHYHFRVVATNATGIANGPGSTFRTYPSYGPQSCPNDEYRGGEASHLPDCRAYEQVTPIDKGDQNAPHANTKGGQIFQPQVSADGDKAVFWAWGAPKGSAAAMPYSLSTRGTSDWTSEAIVPSQGAQKTILCLPGFIAFSDDLSRGLYLNNSRGIGGGGCGANDPPLVPEEPQGAASLFLRDNVTGTYQLVNSNPLSGTPRDAELEGATPDLSVIIFRESAELTPEATSGRMLYRRAGNELSLVSLIPVSPATSCSGAACTAVAGAKLGSLAPRGAGTGNVARAVSADGARTFFRAGANLYVREGDMTVQVDASQGPGASGGGTFMTAEASTGSSVIFSADSKLTPDSTATPGHPELYRYEVDSGTLTDLTVNAGEANGADVQGVLGASEDTSYLYFVANGVLSTTPNSQGDEAAAGEPNLYLLHDGETTFIGTLAVGDRTNWGDGSPGGPKAVPWTSRVTPDGRHVAFESTENLTGYDNSSLNPADCEGIADDLPGECIEIFIYDADADQLHCASCNPSGLAPIGDSRIDGLKSTPIFYARGDANNLWMQRNLSDSGTRLFFRSGDALSPADTNGKQDVYEWEATGTGSCKTTTPNGGCLYLISSGRSDGDSYFYDASASGDDVMFITYERLVGKDRDGLRDLYDARVGGGLAAQYPPPSTPCDPSSGACEAPGSVPPAQVGAGSAVFSGPGNPTRRAQRAKRKKRQRSKRRRKGRRGRAGRRGRSGRGAGRRGRAGKRAGRRLQDGKRAGRRHNPTAQHGTNRRHK